MRKTILLSFGAFVIGHTNIAADPADTTVCKYITDKDGKSVKAYLSGDEYSHCWKAQDGKCFFVDNKGMSLLKANKASEPRKQLKRRTVVGDKRCLVILVEFPDLKFDTSTNYEGKDPNHADPQLRFDGIFNKKGYNYYGYYGSVRDYFEDQSNGKLRLNFDVVGPVMASHNHDYYGRDWANKTRELVAEACTAVDENVDFSKYDWDEKGEVDQVILIYAGLGQSVGGDETTIWAHKSELGRQRKVFDGVLVDTYCCASEKRRGYMGGIGTICHEFSHCLGLPDMYAQNGKDYGTQYYDLMGSGGHNMVGAIPAGYTALDKILVGWQMPKVLRDNEDVKGMKAMSEGGDFYIIPNDEYKNEFYLLEYRRRTGWDSALYSSGILVLHVDYDEDLFSRNIVNRTDLPDNDHERCKIVACDNSYKETPYDIHNDLYDTGCLTDDSTPCFSLYHPNIDGKMTMGKSILNINSNFGESMNFTFKNGLKEQKVLHVCATAPKFLFTSENSIDYTVTLNNRSYADYTDKVKCVLYRELGNGEYEEAMAMENASSLNLLQEQTIDAKFTFSNLFADTKYKLMTYYLKNGKYESCGDSCLFDTADNKKFSLRDKGDGKITGITENSATLEVTICNDSYLEYNRNLAAYYYSGETDQFDGSAKIRNFKLPAHGEKKVLFNFTDVQKNKYYDIYLYSFDSADATEWTLLSKNYSLLITDNKISGVEDLTTSSVIDGKTDVKVYSLDGKLVYVGKYSPALGKHLRGGIFVIKWCGGQRKVVF